MDAAKCMKIAMIKKGISQEQLGILLGLSQSTVSGMANRPNWNCDSLQRVADALGMKVSELVALGED